MPLIHTIQINATAKIGIWKISEPEDFFLNTPGIQKKIKHPYKRLQHLAGRRLISILEPDIILNKIKISVSGKPYLPQESYQFSISHSENYAAAIVSEHCRVGIDVEKMSPKLVQIAPKFLNAQERSQKSDPPLSWYALCWSAKEAVYKWYGQKGILFKEHIHLQPFQMQKTGTIHCLFQNERIRQKLTLHFRMNNEFVLVWVAEGEK